MEVSLEGASKTKQVEEGRIFPSGGLVSSDNKQGGQTSRAREPGQSC